MNKSHLLIAYLMIFFTIVANFEGILCGEYSEYPSYETKSYEHHHHDYHPPQKKSGANIDINIPFDLPTLAKFGVLGFTKLNLLLALTKVAGASLGVSAIGLGKLGKIALKVGHGHKGGGIAIDVGAPHAKSHSHYEHVHHEPIEKHY